jgi:methyl-accepting chemotaxis protein
MPRLPTVSILFKLYAIIALFATVTVMLAVVAIDSARRQARLAFDFEAALQGAQNVERMNSLVYAVTVESRGIYIAKDAAAIDESTGRMTRFNEELLKLATGWQHAARPEQAEAFRPLADQIRQFYEFRWGDWPPKAVLRPPVKRD